MRAVPRAAGEARDRRQAVRSAGRRDPRYARDAGRRAHHALELLQLPPEDRPRRVRRRTNEVVCAAMEAEGIQAEVQYPPMNHYELFQPSLSRLPVAVEYADRLDPHADVVPRRRGRGLRESVYFMETTFRDGEHGVQDAAEALAKIQANAEELPGRLRSASGRTAAGSARFTSSSASSRGRAVSRSATSGFAISAVSASLARSGQRRRDREALVVLRVRDEPVHLGRKRIDRQRVGAVAIDRAGDLDDVVVGQVGDRAVVAHVHDLHVAGAGVQRRDQRRGRVGVEGAAPLLQQLRLRVEGRVLVQLEQARPRSPSPLRRGSCRSRWCASTAEVR